MYLRSVMRTTPCCLRAPQCNGLILLLPGSPTLMFYNSRSPYKLTYTGTYIYEESHMYEVSHMRLVKPIVQRYFSDRQTEIFPHYRVKPTAQHNLEPNPGNHGNHGNHGYYSGLP